jgi:hypothetical protein
VGTWGVGLYDNDDAQDLREGFKDVVRAPWDGDRLLQWVIEEFPAASNAADTSYSDLRLALADLFWVYGIDHPQVRDDAIRLVTSGADLEAKRLLGMSDRDLTRRARLLEQHAEKWRAANPKPRRRRMLEHSEPFVLEVGDCLTYPTAVGRVRNPYITPAREDRFYETYPWVPDAWAAAIVLARHHRFETFARYLIAVLRYHEQPRPDFERFGAMDILHSKTFMPTPLRRVHHVSTRRLHLERMRVEVVGNVSIAEQSVREAFANQLTTSGREFANDAWTLPDMYLHRPELLAPADVRDPIEAFLVS